jgi:glycerol kinase
LQSDDASESEEPVPKGRVQRRLAMSKTYYLGVDQGTTGTTALILDEQWNVRAKGYKEHTQHYPKPGWVEHDPCEIWQRT